MDIIVKNVVYNEKEMIKMYVEAIDSVVVCDDYEDAIVLKNVINIGKAEEFLFHFSKVVKLTWEIKEKD